MGSEESAEVVFPLSADGHRSTSAVGRAVVADALRAVDPAGSLAAEREQDWRAGYLVHFRRLVEAGLPSGDAAVSVARDGLESLHRRMRVAGAGGQETGFDALLVEPAPRVPDTVTVSGTGTAVSELSLPYHGEELRGSALLHRLDAWVAGGIIEPSCAEAVKTVAANPEWLRLPGRTVAVLGAGAEVGPLPALLNWGARVIAIDLPRPVIWERLQDLAQRSGGTLLAPVAHHKPGQHQPGAAADAVAGPGLGGAGLDGPGLGGAGLDLISAVPAVADWLAAVDGPLVLGNYLYADGRANVLLSAAVEALTVRLQAARDDVALASLATPTDVFAVPADAVAQSARAYATRPMAAKVAGYPLRTLSGGRLLRRAYLPGVEPGISDSLVAQQGPNYALAKRLQRWRATVARHDGATVSMNVAPPTRTRSVLKNRMLAAAYAGAHRFGVEVFEPATCKVLMAALLVHDLHAAGPVHAHPWQDEAHAAAHGGLWRIAYAPRTALSLAALMGYGAARK
jgi:hypothetical protein